MECEEFVLPDWSPPDDPVRPCRPKAGYGLVMIMMMMMVMMILTDRGGETLINSVSGGRKESLTSLYPDHCRSSTTKKLLCEIQRRAYLSFQKRVP